MPDVVKEYGHGCRLVREEREGTTDILHFEGPLGRIKSFERPGKANLYADVYTIMGGFREEKTGERGVPPSVARAREDVLMAYLAAQPSMSVQWVARHFDVSEEHVRLYLDMVQERAAEQREEGDGEEHSGQQ